MVQCAMKIVMPKGSLVFETAIVLIAFILVASVFDLVVSGAGFYTTQNIIFNRESVRIHRFFEDNLDRLIQSDPKYKDVGYLLGNGLDGSLKNHDGDFNRMHWDWTIDNPLSGRGTLPIRWSRFFYFTRIVL